MTDLTDRLRALSRMEHSDYTIGDEAADTIDRLMAALELIAAPMRPDGTWNRERLACQQIAVEALKAAP